MGAEALVGGLAVSAVGTMMQLNSANEASDAQKRGLAEQQKTETIRERSAVLDAQRKKREIIRQSIIARSQALAVGVNQGAQFGSALPGAYGQISGQAKYNIAGIDSSLDLSQQIFASNRSLLEARKAEADAGSSAAFGSGVSSIGKSIAGNSSSLGNLFSVK